MYKILYKKLFNLLKKSLHTSLISEGIKFLVIKVLQGGNKNAFKDFTLYHKRKLSLP